ncbi:unnamed protein product [Mycena citricolor]|uniref:HAT C-terminal dimerisation domain-containing protein n=1 Tax=Mycena citricolor TaxID=2018698 RepID=A0AAD2H1U0_9AGAR|nr:unnamed protein product [Mycena citricolor]
MMLDPLQKFNYFAAQWSDDLMREVVDTAEKIFKFYWLKAGGAQSEKNCPQKKARTNKYKSLASDDEDDVPTRVQPPAAPNVDVSRPWSQDFRKYIELEDEIVPEGTNVIDWWSRNHQRFHPGWRLLALDYLAIQAASVSCERAFSSSGITISDRRNRLKGDIVEALQFLKCSFREDLLIREFLNSDNEPLLILEDNSADSALDGFRVWDDCLADEPDEGEDDEDIQITV